VIDLGGRWDDTIREDHDNAQLNGTLQLFCGMLRFRRACERHIRQLTAGIRDGSIKPTLETREVELYDNPRANKR
jgi:hypothetical protein